MRRRDFITLVGAAAAAWPLVTRAQQRVQMRRIAVVTGLARNDPETKVRTAAFLQELQRLGWIEGSNVQVDIRGVVGTSAAGRKNVAELVALKPDVILVYSQLLSIQLALASCKAWRGLAAM